MSEPDAASGTVIDIGPFEEALGGSRATTMLRTDRLAVIQLVVTPQKEVPTHKFQGESTIHCLRGRVIIGPDSHRQELIAGQLLHYSSNESFALKAIEDAMLLVTVALPPSQEGAELLG